MFYTIMGIIVIIIAIWGLAYTLKNKRDMPITIHGYRRTKSEFTDLRKINNIMIIENICVCLWLLLTGVLCIVIKESIALCFISFAIFINLFFSIKAKRFIKTE